MSDANNEPLQGSLTAVITGSCVLAMVAGFFNAFIFAFMNSAVAGVTNPLTEGLVQLLAVRSGIDVSRGLFFFLQVLCFMVGAFCGGLITPSPTLDWKMPYGVVFVLCGLLCVGGTILLWQREEIASRMLIAIAMGLNNCITAYRTDIPLPFTHLTGLVGTIAAIAGRGIRGRFERDKDTIVLMLYVPVLVSFAVGCLIGALFTAHPLFLLIPSLIYVIFGVVVFIFSRIYFRAASEPAKD
jgi:uncharacterized membrane protein YoaK (UPF0700 family)